MALKDVQNLTNEDDGSVSLFPVVVKGTVAQRFKEKVSMRQTVVADEDFLD